MPKIKLGKRYKYAGDIMPKLLEIGFDLETAQDFLNSIKDAEAAPKSEVAREIFAEINAIKQEYASGDIDGNELYVRLYMLEKKYTEATDGAN